MENEYEMKKKWKEDQGKFSVHNTKKLIGQDVVILKGHHKGYKGTLRRVTLKYAFIELPGLAEGNNICRVINPAVVSAYVLLCARIVSKILECHQFNFDWMKGPSSRVIVFFYCSSPSKRKITSAYAWGSSGRCLSVFTWSCTWWCTPLLCAVFFGWTFIGPCQFLFNESSLDGGKSYVQPVGTPVVVEDLQILWPVSKRPFANYMGTLIQRCGIGMASYMASRPVVWHLGTISNILNIIQLNN